MHSSDSFMRKNVSQKTTTFLLLPGQPWQHERYELQVATIRLCSGPANNPHSPPESKPRLKMKEILSDWRDVDTYRLCLRLTHDVAFLRNQRIVATRVFNVCLLHAVAFYKELYGFAQNNVITLKTQTHAVNARWKCMSQISFTCWSPATNRNAVRKTHA